MYLKIKMVHNFASNGIHMSYYLFRKAGLKKLQTNAKHIIKIDSMGSLFYLL